MTDRELMQQALHTLEGWANHGKWVWPESALEQAKRNTTESIAALRERLAQPEMQPCAGRNCGSTNPNLHSAECFEDYEKSTGMAQPEQEPVAWMYTCEGDTGLPVLVHTQKDWARASWWKEIPLYTAPRQWQGLTDEEIVTAYGDDLKYRDGDYMRYARAIEAKLKEKNT